MIARQGQHHGLPVNDESVGAGRIVVGRPHEPKIQRPAEDRADLVVRHHLAKDDFDAGMLFLKAADAALDQSGHAHDRHEADFNASDLAARRLTGHDFGLIDFAQDVARALEEPLAGLRQHDMRIAAPFDQLGAQTRLKLLDLVGQRRRADAQIDGCPAEMLLVGERHKIPKQPGLDLAHAFDAI